MVRNDEPTTWWHVRWYVNSRYNALPYVVTFIITELLIHYYVVYYCIFFFTYLQMWPKVRERMLFIAWGLAVKPKFCI